MKKTDLSSIYPPIQPYRKYSKEKSNPRKLAILTKTQAVDNPTSTNMKEEKHTQNAANNSKNKNNRN